jgi:pyruvate dehydrogenase phosphatase
MSVWRYRTGTSDVCPVANLSFVNLDDNIVKTPLRLLAQLPPQISDPNAPPSQEILDFDKVVAPANHGAVAISSVIDVENDDLFVAVTGDCRAIAGWQDKNGTWRCDVLSEDQEGENKTEIRR